MDSNIESLRRSLRNAMLESAIMEAAPAMQNQTAGAINPVSGDYTSVVGQPKGLGSGTQAPAVKPDDTDVVKAIKDYANQYLNALGVVAEQRESDAVGAKELLATIPGKVTELVRNFFATNKTAPDSAKLLVDSWKKNAAAGGGFIRGLQNLFGSEKSAQATKAISDAIDAAFGEYTRSGASRPLATPAKVSGGSKATRTGTGRGVGTTGGNANSANIIAWIANIRAIDNAWGSNPIGTANKWLSSEKDAIAKYKSEFAGKKYGTHDMLSYMKGQVDAMSRALAKQGRSRNEDRDQLGNMDKARNVAKNGLQQDDADVINRDRQMAQLLNQSNITKTLLNKRALVKSLVRNGDMPQYVTVYFDYNGAVDYNRMWALAKKSITSMLLGETDASVTRGLINKENSTIFPTTPGGSHGVVDGASDNQGTGYARILVNAWPLKNYIKV